MAHLPSGFWAGWIAVLTATGLATLTWVILSFYFSGKGELHEKSPVWDKTLTEGSNAPPLWWFWLILEVDPGFGTLGLVGNEAVPLLNGTDDDEEDETED